MLQTEEHPRFDAWKQSGVFGGRSVFAVPLKKVRLLAFQAQAVFSRLCDHWKMSPCHQRTACSCPFDNGDSKTGNGRFRATWQSQNIFHKQKLFTTTM